MTSVQVPDELVCLLGRFFRVKGIPPVFLLILTSKFRDFPLLTWIPPMFFWPALFLRWVSTRKNYTPRIFHGVSWLDVQAVLSQYSLS